MAERVGFEPTIRISRILDFESNAFDHSAISPKREYYHIRNFFSCTLQYFLQFSALSDRRYCFSVVCASGPYHHGGLFPWQIGFSTKTRKEGGAGVLEFSIGRTVGKQPVSGYHIGVHGHTQHESWFVPSVVAGMLPAVVSDNIKVVGECAVEASSWLGSQAVRDDDPRMRQTEAEDAVHLRPLLVKPLQIK